MDIAIPVIHRRRDEDVELLLLILDEAGQADKALRTLRQAARRGAIEIMNVAVLVKDADGRTFLKEIADIGTKRGVLFGVVTRDLIGLLGGPVGGVVGPATGGAAARRIDIGFPDAYLIKLRAALQPGTSSIIALVEQAWADNVVKALSGFGGQLLRQMLRVER